MPINYKKYPKNWKSDIRPRILERAGHKCEQCGVPNCSIIMRSLEDKSQYLVLHDDGIYRTLEGVPIRLSDLPECYWDAPDIKIVLTIAHLNHDITDNSDDNLAALCQRCHLVHDAPHHVKNAARTRRKKHEQETGQLPMFPGLE